jgi:hypothetical protein
MSFIEIEQQALRLPDSEKAHLVCKLLEALPSADVDAPDEDVAERERRLEAGEIEELSHDEFVRRVREERGR